MLKTIEKNKLVETNELGFEILVSYLETWNVDKFDEDFHGIHPFLDYTLVDIQLESVEVMVKGFGIDILKSLNDKQRDAICWELENM
jgi:uncharacterized protein YutD